MDRNITNLTKFFCCALIFFHHFFILEDFICTWGRIACSVFFFLSAYGISKSLQKKKYGFLPFCGKRLARIYIPYMLVNILAIMESWAIVGSFSVPIYKLIGFEMTFLDAPSALTTIGYILGLKKMDGVTWFLDVLLISYVFIWLVRKIKGKALRISAILVVPVSLLIIDRLLDTHVCYMPTDVVGIVAALIYVEYETAVNAFVKRYLRPTLLVSLMLFALSVGFYTHYRNSNYYAWRYMEVAMLLYSLSSIVIVLCLSSLSLWPLLRSRYARCCTLLGGISFFIYLIHMKVIDTLSYYGLQPLIAWSLALTLSLSFLLFYIDRFIQDRLWKSSHSPT